MANLFSGTGFGTVQPRPASLTSGAVTTGGPDPKPAGTNGGDPVAGALGTQWQRYLFNQDQNAGGLEWLRRQGIDPLSQYGQFFMNRIPTSYAGYTAASAQNPGLDFLDYLSGQQGSVDNAFALQKLQQYRPVPPRRWLP